MKITILCSEGDHPVRPYLERWMGLNAGVHDIDLVRNTSGLAGGDILFLISCSEIIRARNRGLYRKTLVMHASALPMGRGWSPHIWQILDGCSEITLTLLEAEDKVDSGAIWRQSKLGISRTALWNEINDRLFEAELAMMDFAVEQMETIRPYPQDPAVEPSYFPKRTPADSRISVDESIAGQFDLIRVCDPVRYPAHFEFRGRKFRIRLEAIDE